MALRAMGSVGDVEADVGYGGGLLSTGSPAGWATIWALVAFVALMFLVGRGEGGLLRKGMKSIEFVVLVGLAVIPFNYLVRAWSLASDSDLADGLAIDV